jgi:1,2-phenylacetyl-CoA epoxidase catalytic subunit
MLKELEIDPNPVEHDRGGEEYASMAALDEPAPDWAALVAMMVLADGALSTMLETFSSGTFSQARTRVPKMLAEETFHESLGSAWYRRLADTTGEARALLTEATERMLPGVLAWVGADDAAAQSVAETGVIAAASDRLSAFRDRVRPLTGLVGVDVDEVAPSSDWDESRGRTAGRPTEESVERARGDRNRVLLVE